MGTSVWIPVLGIWYNNHSIGGCVTTSEVVSTGSRKLVERVDTVRVPSCDGFSVQGVLSGSVQCGNVHIVRADIDTLLRIFGPEEDAPACSVASHQIVSTADEDDVFMSLPSDRPLCFAHLIYLLGLQADGADGLLSTTEQPTVFYRGDAAGHRHAILVLWEEGLFGCAGGWHIRVYDPVPTAGVSESLYPGTRILRVE